MASAVLWPYSAERLFLFVVSKRLRAFRNYFFTGGVVEENGICSAAFCESAALRGSTPSVIAYGDATFPKGTASAVAGNFAAAPKGVPLGELSRSD